MSCLKIFHVLKPPYSIITFLYYSAKTNHIFPYLPKFN
nr:MAG TPA: hypothetical protein [Caudoviricetes sp.]